MLSMSVAVSAASLDEASLENPKDAQYDSYLKYDSYLSRYADKNRGEQTILIPADTRLPQEDAAAQLVDSYKGAQNVLIFSGNGEKARWKFSVKKEGRYCVALTFYNMKTGKNNLSVGVMLDGDYPFAQARGFKLPQAFVSDGQIKIDKTGNQYAPRMVEKYQWTEHVLSLSAEGFDYDVQLYLTAGTHTLELDCGAASFALKQLRVLPPKKTVSYAEYLSACAGADAGESFLQIEGESAVLTSDSALRPSSVKSAGMSPYSANKIRINMIGTNWSRTGQWIEWRMNVEKEGLYSLNFRYQQSYAIDFFVNRRLYLDGEVPFTEANALRFPFNLDWEFRPLSTPAGEAVKLYLTPGEHTLRLEVVLGDYEESIRNIGAVVSALNEIYREIIMITGVSPDPYQDYALEKSIPGLLDSFRRSRDVLAGEYSRIREITGTNAAQASFLNVFASQLSDFIERPETIPRRISEYSSNIGSLSAWCNDIKSQPLDIDYIYLAGSRAPMPRPKVGFVERLVHEVKSLFYSFVEDYTMVSTGGDAAESGSIEVWASTGRDQAQVIRTMVDDMFTPSTSISVTLKLVTAGLVEAFLSGRSPDVVLSLGRGEPVNYAMRGALLDISSFSDFEQVTGWFMPSAVVPYYYGDGCFGLPDTQNFYVQFYRKDILTRLGIPVPATWDAFRDALNVLQRYNMEAGIPYATIGSSSIQEGSGVAESIFSALLLQNGGNFLSPDGKTSTLNTDSAYTAFEQWCRLYRDYGLPLSYSFFNRFRSGEMPLAIDRYTTYTQLIAAAPEIDGLWGIAPIPGTIRPDGRVDISQAASGTASVILSNTDNPQLSWKFLKWWVGAEAQARYAGDLESQLGVMARMAVANVEAFQELSWRPEQYSAVYDQWQQVKEIPEVPGSYLIRRVLDNAFRTVLYDDKNARDTLNIANKLIGDEIARKRKEFGLD
jgi:ABC-type glycerol-3-phosphate transport system substrate-binding protein